MQSLTRPPSFPSLPTFPSLFRCGCGSGSRFLTSPSGQVMRWMWQQFQWVKAPAGCACSWQRPVFNIYFNRNAISWLMWLDPIWQWSLSPVFLPSVILLPSRDLKGLKITAPRYTFITFLSLTFWKHVINEAFPPHKKWKRALMCSTGFDLWPHFVREVYSFLSFY